MVCKVVPVYYYFYHKASFVTKQMYVTLYNCIINNSLLRFSIITNEIAQAL